MVPWPVATTGSLKGDKGVALGLGQVHGVFAGLVIDVAVKNDLGTVVLGALDLDERRGGGHDHYGFRARARGGEGDALGVVAGAGGDDAARELFGRKGGNLVVRAADLVGSGALHVLGLEPYAVARCGSKVGALDQLGLLRNFLDLDRGLFKRL